MVPCRIPGKSNHLTWQEPKEDAVNRLSSFFSLGLFNPHRGFRSNGEIAIIVSAFEFSPMAKVETLVSLLKA